MSDAPIVTAEHAPPVVDDATRRRVLVSSTIGTAIEWYDFYLYSTAAALVLGPLFLPTGSPVTSTLAAFATYAVGFVARPLGGIVFGHFGDRLGRKSMLVLTLLIMGVATFALGLLPTYEQIGVWAPILLVTLRVLQGIGIGGEWGGAVLLAAEYAPPGRRGWYASWPQVGYPAGFFAGTVAFTAVAQLRDADFLGWGWRLPFLASALLVVVGLIIRLRIADSPVFTELRATRQTARRPLVEALRTQPRDMLTGVLAALGHGMIVTIFTVYLLSYGSGPDGADRQVVLTGLMIAAGLQCIAVPVFGALADRIGPRPVLVGGYAAGALAIWPGLTWTTSGNPLLITATFVLAMSIGHGAAYGALSGYLAGLFPARVRFSAISATYQVGSTLSSFGPLAAAALVATTDATWPVAALALATALLAALAVARARPAPAQA